MTTTERIEINRRNAQNSTGPKTPHGKALASRNSLRHGLRSRDAVLPNEDPAEFEDLLCRLHDEFSPSTLSQEIFLDQMAVAYWKLGRQQRMENQVIVAQSPRSDNTEDDPESEAPDITLGRAYLRDSNRERALPRLSAYENRLERSYLRAYHELTKTAERSQSTP